MQITSDSPALVAAIAQLFDVMGHAGAVVHPGLRIVESGGEISAWAEGEDPWLMRIPEATLVPVGDIVWSAEPPLTIIDAPGLTALQREVLDACVHVMRTSGTWEHFRSTHPRATITDPDAIAVIQSLHPAFSPATSAAAMLKTRTIRMSLHDEEPQSYLMPLLDLVNHHPGAPVYLPGDGYLSIATAQEAPSAECYVSYGSTKDVLGIALAYGYLDEHITRANAVPGEYPLPGGGSLRLVRASRPDFTSEPGVLTIVGAGFDAADSTVTRRTLVEPIERFLGARGTPALQARHSARVLTHQIRSDNAERLTHARSALTSVPGSTLAVAAITRQEQLTIDRG